MFQVVAPTIGSPACQEQLVEAAKLVARSVEGIVAAAQSACKDDVALQDLGGAATAVTKSLNDLLQHIKKAGGPVRVRYLDNCFFYLSVCLSVCLSVYISI